MIDQTARPAGSIYDLGYRPYEGSRLGRAYAFVSLFAYSVRAVFGLGRSALNKAFPIGLAGLALAPAAFQLGIAALAPQDFEFVSPEGYFEYVQIIVALFCAAAAPDLIGRDHRNRTLPLYFSRTLKRFDYVSAKLVAFFASILLVILMPQLLLFVGTAVSTEAVVDYFADNLDQLPPILLSSIIASIFLATVSMALACQTPKRALATGAVLVYFVVFTTLGQTFVDTTTGEGAKYLILISPLDVLNGMVYWLFDASPDPNSILIKADQTGEAYLLAALGYILLSLAIVYRRFLRLQV